MTSSLWQAAALGAAPLLGAAVSLAAERTIANWTSGATMPGKPAGSTRQVVVCSVIAFAIGAISLMAWGATPWALAAAAIGLGFLHSGLIDLRLQLLPHAPTILGAAAGLAWAWSTGGVAGVQRSGLGLLAVGGGLAAIALWSTWRLGPRGHPESGGDDAARAPTGIEAADQRSSGPGAARLGPSGLGTGDVLLGGAGGLMLGPWLGWAATTVAAVAAAGVFLVSLRRKDAAADWRSQRFAFGPYLLVAYWLAWAGSALGWI